MSILEKRKIDIIGTDKISGNIILTISDQLDWDDDLLHLSALQEKLNTYMEFIESGQINEDYPNSSGKKMIIEIVSEYDYASSGKDFLEKVKSIFQSLGVEILQRTLNSR